MRTFLDSNVLIYAYSIDRRRERATEILADGGVISVQILAEFANVARRRLQIGGGELLDAIQTLTRRLEIGGSVTMETLRRGLGISSRYNLSIHDSTLIAVALAAGCDEFLSEDLHHGMVVEDRLTVRNPFLPV